MAQGARVKTAVAAAVLLALAGCGHNSSGAAGANASGGLVGYVDLDAVVAAHPLHGQLQAMQDQITLLQQEAALVPTGMTPEQTAAYDQLQAALAQAETKYDSDLAARRAYYEQREQQAISQLQSATLGARPDAGGILSGLQQQFGSQARSMQQQALATLSTYRNQLFKQDSDHLREVQTVLAQDVRTKLAQAASQMSAAQTKYAVSLGKADQNEKLNLQTKLQDLSLSDAERAQYQSRLRSIDAAEQTKLNAMKARDEARYQQLAKQLQAQAAARYDAERKATQAATTAKLIARQKQLQTHLQPQLVALNGKFQQQLNAANQKLAGNPKYQAQAQSIHDQMQSGYVAEAEKATAQYDAIRAALVKKYSDIAHMQFEDNEALSEQAQRIAAQRRDLYQKIVAQAQTQIQDIATKSGVGIVLTNVRGAGTAVDLTAKVEKALAQLNVNAGASPQPGGSGG
jgi:Skp family chaperone for outer membrane proteins